MLPHSPVCDIERPVDFTAGGAYLMRGLRPGTAVTVDFMFGVDSGFGRTSAPVTLNQSDLHFGVGTH